MSSVEIEKYTFETTHRITLKLRVFSTLCNFYTCGAESPAEQEYLGGMDEPAMHWLRMFKSSINQIRMHSYV